MFVQVIQGRTGDPAGVKRQFERWSQELAPAAIGFLGSTAGVTDDGDFVAVARFASEDEARSNSDRPEQGQWWEDFVKTFDGEPTVHDCPDAELFLGGGSDEAGFVQVMQSRITDRDAARAAVETMNTMDPRSMGRPDLIGGFAAWHSDSDALTQVIYFTSEAEAREGEAKEPPPEVAEAMTSWDAAFGETRYFDLLDPWMASPSS